MATKLNHIQKVLRLYKKSYRHLESWNGVDRIDFLYQATLLRERFDIHKNEPDMRVATKLLAAGEDEFWKFQHPQPYKWIDSPGGTRFERDVPSPEFVLDMWHPREKAQYPIYFARREKRLAAEKARWEELVAEEKAILEGIDKKLRS